jgi:ABC-type Fe3+/spermidine/putrescine transport system ATPase subunit
MNVLYGLYRPDEGEIVLNGNPITFHSSGDAIRAGIGMVHQHFTLVPSFTVAENLALGEGGYNLVLAGAHGAPPQLAEGTRERMAVNGESVAQAVDKALVALALGRVAKYVYPFLYLDVLPGRDPDAVRLSAGRAAMEHRAVAGFYTANGQSSSHDGWEQRFRNSFHARRSGDVMLAYHPEYVEDYGQGRGVSYGSLYNYDARVPLCFYGPSFRAGVFEAPVESVDVAPTLARLTGIPVPSSSVGRVLGEALAE